jgi:hypothetical protein
MPVRVRSSKLPAHEHLVNEQDEVQEYTLAIATYSYIDLILNEEMYVVVMKSKNCLSLPASKVTPILRNEICIPSMTQAG